MVDYKLIADSDPGGTLSSAFNAMSAETVSGTPEVMVTYRRVSASVGLTASAELETAVTGAQTMPSWVDKALSLDGIDVNDPQTAGLLSALVTPETAAAIIAMGVISEPKYKGLKIGHLENARQMRAAGEI